MREMLVVVSCPVTLMNNQAISRKEFLNEPTCNLVMSLGTTAGFSRNLGKRSNPLSFFFKNYLQYSPLKVSIGLRSLNILQNT